jgi:hypothetical protein
MPKVVRVRGSETLQQEASKTAFAAGYTDRKDQVCQDLSRSIAVRLSVLPKEAQARCFRKDYCSGGGAGGET